MNSTLEWMFFGQEFIEIKQHVRKQGDTALLDLFDEFMADPVADLRDPREDGWLALFVRWYYDRYGIPPEPNECNHKWRDYGYGWHCRDCGAPLPKDSLQ